MTKEEAIKILKSKMDGSVDTSYEWTECVRLAVQALEQEPRWIPCSERLPEEPYMCIVTVKDTNPMTFDELEDVYHNFARWDGETWIDAGWYPIPFETIAWMPLPEPWKGKEE